MGRQHVFAMDEEDEILFMEYLRGNGYVIYQDDKSGIPKLIEKFPEPFSSKGWFILYLYRSNFGEMKFRELNDGRLYLDAGIAPVIEFSRTIVRHGNVREIQFGRIWVEMKYYDENEMLVKKSEELDKGYKDIKRWINKQLGKSNVHFKSGACKECVISKSLIKLIEENKYKSG